MTEFNVIRFKAMIAAVEAVGDGHFDLNTWKTDSPTCGTTYCSCGAYAASLPERFEMRSQSHPCPKGLEVNYSVCDRKTGRIMDLVQWSIEFGISYDESVNLFSANDNDNSIKYPENFYEYVERLKRFYKNKTGKDYVSPGFVSGDFFVSETSSASDVAGTTA